MENKKQREAELFAREHLGKKAMCGSRQGLVAGYTTTFGGCGPGIILTRTDGGGWPVSVADENDIILLKGIPENTRFWVDFLDDINLMLE